MGGYRKKEQVTRILHHFLAYYHEAAIKNWRGSYQCLGTNMARIENTEIIRESAALWSIDRCYMKRKQHLCSANKKNFNPNPFLNMN